MASSKTITFKYCCCCCCSSAVTIANLFLLQLSEAVEITRNSYRANEVSARGDGSIENNVEEYIKSHDATFKLPAVGSVTLAARNLDNDEIDFKINFGNGVQEG